MRSCSIDDAPAAAASSSSAALVPYSRKGAWPVQIAAATLNKQRMTGGQEAAKLLLLPWEESRKGEFESLVRRDRRRNLAARAEYYASRGFLAGKGWMELLMKDQHVVWHPEEKQEAGAGASQAFAYTVGLYYLYGVPEVLLTAEAEGKSGGSRPSSRDLAKAVQAIVAAALAGSLTLETGTRVPASRLASSLPSLSSDVTLELSSGAPTPAGNATWFYANFLDQVDFPILTGRI